MSAPLGGKTALVTGAARGIGRAAVIELARQGAAVALLDRDEAGETGAAVRAAGGDVLLLEADLGEEAQVLSAFERLDRWAGRLDIVVNNAGILIERPLLETSTADFDRILGVNLRGTFLVGREAIRRMCAARRVGAREGDGQGDGEGAFRVINLASELAYLGRAEFSAYCASKAAVLGLTRSWAREFAPHILVNAVAPGPVDTAMLDLENMSAEWREKESDIPLGRVGRPEEIAHVIAFLAGPGASFMTGQALGPNGGAVMA